MDSPFTLLLAAIIVTLYIMATSVKDAITERG